jgi:hypothetical protein
MYRSKKILLMCGLLLLFIALVIVYVSYTHEPQTTNEATRSHPMGPEYEPRLGDVSLYNVVAISASSDSLAGNQDSSLYHVRLQDATGKMRECDGIQSDLGRYLRVGDQVGAELSGDRIIKIGFHGHSSPAYDVTYSPHPSSRRIVLVLFALSIALGGMLWYFGWKHLRTQRLNGSATLELPETRLS